MIFLNDVLQGLYGEHLFRILTVENMENRVWLIQLGDTHAWPFPRNLEKLVSLVKAGSIKSVNGPSSTTTCSPSEAAQRRRDILWSLVEPLLSNPEIYIPHKRALLVKHRAQEASCSKQTLYTCLRRYWQNGLSKNALIPNFHKCASKPGQTGNRGRKPLYRTGPIYQVSNDDLNTITKFLRLTYVKQETMTIPAAYQRYLEKHHTFTDGNLQMHIKADGEKPTLKQFTRVLKSALKSDEIYRGKHGDKAYERNKRPRLGSVGVDAKHIGDFYEIDATIADVFLASSVDPSKLVGKPTLYLVFDRFSRLIVSFHVSLETASWETARIAIANISADKQKLCLEHDITYHPEDWPAHGLFPRAFLADRGEILSKNSNVIINGMEITVANLPSQRPDHKPIVECGFKQIQSSFREGMPGYEPPEQHGKRRTKRYNQEACLTLKQFTAVLLSTIITHNRKVMANYTPTVDQLSDRLVPTPIAIWGHNVVRHSGALRRFEDTIVRHALLPRGVATVSREGIEFGGCYYTCPEAKQQGWFLGGNRNKSFKVEVSFHPSNVNEIYIYGMNKESTAIQASLLEKSVAFAGMSFDEVRLLQSEHAKMLSRYKTHNQQLELENHAQIDPVVAKAYSLMKSSTQRQSLRSRTSQTKAYRELEKRLEQQNNSEAQQGSYPIEPEPCKVRPITQSRQPTQAAPQETPEEKRQRLKKEALNAH